MVSGGVSFAMDHVIIGINLSNVSAGRTFVVSTLCAEAPKPMPHSTASVKIAFFIYLLYYMLCINLSAWFCWGAAASTISLLCGIDEPQKTAMCIL